VQWIQPFEPLAHVGDPGGQIDPGSWTQSNHGLRPLQDAHQALERIRIKIRVHLDPAPARQHHGQPTTRFVLLWRFPGGQLHRHQPTGRRSWSTPSLPTSLFQMAIQSAEAQTSTLAKLASPHTAAHKLSQPTAGLPLVYVAWALTTLILLSSGHFNTDTACRTGVLVRRLRSIR